VHHRNNEFNALETSYPYFSSAATDCVRENPIPQSCFTASMSSSIAGVTDPSRCAGAGARLEWNIAGMLGFRMREVFFGAVFLGGFIGETMLAAKRLLVLSDREG